MKFISICILTCIVFLSCYNLNNSIEQVNKSDIHVGVNKLNKIDNLSDYEFPYESIYSEPLDVYYYALLNQGIDSKLYLWSVDSFISYIQSIDGNFKENAMEKYGYCFIDVNRDGTKELLIGNIKENPLLNNNTIILSIHDGVPYEYSNTFVYDTDFPMSYMYEGNSYGIDSFQDKYDPTQAVNMFSKEFLFEDISAFKPFKEYHPNMPKEFYYDARFIEIGKGYDSWQEGYLSFLKHINGNTENYECALIYIDDDRIPELVLNTGVQASGSYILSFYKGMVNALCTDRLYFTYIEGGGLLCNSEGNPGCYYDYVYRLDKGRWINIINGNKYKHYDEDDFAVYDDENIFGVLDYFVNGTEVDEITYTWELKKVYDFDKSKEVNNYILIPEMENILTAI